MVEQCYNVVIGIDEAGRGPVLGDLVIGLVALDEEKTSVLSEYGVRDSKELTPTQRSVLVDIIKRYALLLSTTYIPPTVIDRFKLNRLIAKKIVSMLYNAIELLNGRECIERARIIVDEIRGYSGLINSLIRDRFGLKIEVLIEPRADKKYVVVSAASILAKYFRDRNLFMSKQLYGDYGSGYPSDERTRSWIVENYRVFKEPPLIVRRSWATLKKIAPSWYYSLKRGKSILDYIEK